MAKNSELIIEGRMPTGLDVLDVDEVSDFGDSKRNSKRRHDGMPSPRRLLVGGLALATIILPATETGRNQIEDVAGLTNGAFTWLNNQIPGAISCDYAQTNTRRIEPGDTLWSISTEINPAKTGAVVHSISTKNGIEGPLQPGTYIELPSSCK